MRYCNGRLTRAVILKYAGRDATKAYSEVHAPSVLKVHLPPEKHMGHLNESTITDDWIKEPPSTNPQVVLEHEKPPLHTLINAHDFQVVASKTASAKTWAFYSSAANDLLTRDANKACFDRIWFRPRVLRNVRSVNTRTRMLGVDCGLPLFVSPAAMAKLIHPDGERAIARACESSGIMQGVCTSFSFSCYQTDVYRSRTTPRLPWTNYELPHHPLISSSSYTSIGTGLNLQPCCANSPQTPTSKPSS